MFKISGPGKIFLNLEGAMRLPGQCSSVLMLEISLAWFIFPFNSVNKHLLDELTCQSFVQYQMQEVIKLKGVGFKFLLLKKERDALFPDAENTDAN